MPLVTEFGRAMRAFAFETLGWELGLLRKIKIGESVAYRGEREGITTILTAYHPTRHGLLQTQSGWRHPHLEYPVWCIPLTIQRLHSISCEKKLQFAKVRAEKPFPTVRRVLYAGNSYATRVALRRASHSIFHSLYESMIASSALL